MNPINVTRTIRAPKEKVWNIISDMDKETQFWHGTKNIKIINKKDNVVEREVIIAFRNSKCIETVTLTPTESIDVLIKSGPFRGTKNIHLKEVDQSLTEVNVLWNIKLNGILSIFDSMVKKHITRGTVEALQRILQEGEKENATLV